MMRILFIVVSKNKQHGTKNIITGPERRMANVAGLWKDMGVEAVVCYPPYGSLKQVFTDAGNKVIPFQVKGKYDIRSIRHIVKIIRDGKIDLIHSQGSAATDLITTLAAKKANIPAVITRPVMIADQVHYTAYKKSMYEWIDEHITLKKADKIIAVSQNGFDILKNRYHVKEDKLKMVYNGVDLERFSFHDRPQRIPVIGMVAHLSVFKGWFDFIAVIELLYKQGLHFQAHIIGDGELKKALQDEVLRRNLSGTILFMENVSNVNECLAEMDIFLFTSHREGLSVAVIEALASGLPVVASKVGGIREQVRHGENGFIYNRGDIRQMADAVAQLIQNEELRRTMGEASRNIAVANFSEQEMISSYVTLYKELVKNKLSSAVIT